MKPSSILALCVALAAIPALPGCGGSGSGSSDALDQQNLLDGDIAVQDIGRFDDFDDTPDPSGTSFDWQDAQTFTAAASGLLTRIRVGVLNVDGATEPVVLELREAVFDMGTMTFVPAPDDSPTFVLGSVALPASSFAAADLASPATWPEFDVSGLGLNVVAGTVYCFSLLTADTAGFFVAPEETLSYAGGAAWRRNRAAATLWTELPGSDFCFQTFVDAP